MPIVTTWNREDFVKLFSATKPDEGVGDFVCVHIATAPDEDSKKYAAFIVAEALRAGDYLIRYSEPAEYTDEAEKKYRELMDYLEDNLDAIIVEGIIE